MVEITLAEKKKQEGWSDEQLIDWFAEQSGLPRDYAAEAVAIELGQIDGDVIEVQNG